LSREITLKANSALITIFLLSFLLTQILKGVLLLNTYGPLHFFTILLFIISSIAAFITAKQYNNEQLLNVLPYYLLPCFIPISIGIIPALSGYFLWLVISIPLTFTCVYEIKQTRANFSDYTFYGSIILGTCSGIIFANFPLMPAKVTAFYLPLTITLLCIVICWQRHFKNIKTKETLIIFKEPIILMAVLCLLRIIYIYKQGSSPFLPIIFYYSYATLAVAWCFKFHTNLIQLSFGFAAVILPSLLIATPIPLVTAINFNLLCAAIIFLSIKSNVKFVAVSPYSTLKVAYQPFTNSIALFSNGILHGSQSCNKEALNTAESYYSPSSPIGQLFKILPTSDVYKNIAVVGLGTGSIASYASPSHKITFYEIDQAVIDIATNPKYFSYLHNAQGELEIIKGDARETFTKALNHYYGLIIIDAYFGKEIPNSLFTFEAFKLYLSKLNTSGLILLHISSPLHELENDLAVVFDELKLFALIQYYNPEHSNQKITPQPAGLVSYAQHKTNYDLLSKIENKILELVTTTVKSLGLISKIKPKDEISKWIICAKNKDDLLGLTSNPAWRELRSSANRPLLTDKVTNYQQFR
jgi:hypothetical protein